MRSLVDPRSLWDVDNVEAHVHSTLDAALQANNGSWLSPPQYQRAFAYLLAKCWELGGLQAGYSRPGSAGEGLRFVWEVRGFLAPRAARERYEPIFPAKNPPQFPTRPAAESATAAIAAVRRLVAVSFVEVRPRGAYEPARSSLSFSTYSRRILTKRLTDWYRSDEDFGDSRYRSSRRHDEQSIEALAARRADADGDEVDFLERAGPGSRLEVVDELNRHAYVDSIEDMLTRLSEAAFGRRDDSFEEVAHGLAGC